VKALELDETLPDDHVSLGRVQLFYDWDWPAAEKEFRRSLELNPNLPEAHLGFARYLAAEGRFDESIEHVRTAYALDPLSISARFDGIDDFYLSRRYQVTLDECRKVKELPPDFREPFDVESFVYARTGRFQEAANAAQMAVVHRQGPIDLSWAAAAYAESGRKQEARKLLRQLLAEAQNRFVCGYNVAVVYAAWGETDQAFSWLEEGIKQRSL
jgi:tetratricopeptide (TPR) repeat protein